MAGDVEEGVEAAWGVLVEALRGAGERLARDVKDLSEAERADAYLALLRALSNQLGRFEVDRERPELTPFNGWRQKFFMDNPDFRYWVADIRHDRQYRVTGNRGDAAFMSLTAYAGAGVAQAGATARLDSDSIAFDAAGNFDVVIGGARPANGQWLELPEGSNALWVRHFHGDVKNDRLGWCEIAPCAQPAPIAFDASRFAHQVRRLASGMAAVAPTFAAAAKGDLRAPNTLREWSEMKGGAVFTEPGIHYVRGGWRLEPGEALVIEGDAAPCRYWSILLYSRFLNSLDYRQRTVSKTGATARIENGRYRFVLAAEDPSVGDWLDTEGRPFGIVVMRFLQPTQTPQLPAARVVRVADLRSGA